VHPFDSGRVRAAGGGALVLLAVAACSRGGSSVSIPSTPTPVPSPTAGVGSIGIAYLPDGGNVPGFAGVQVVHFEDATGNLLAGSSPQNVAFPGSVGAFSAAADGSVAVAAQSAAGGAPYAQLQDVFGVAAGNIVPSGPAYATTVGGILPTPAPVANGTPAPAASPTPAATPNAAAVVPDVASVAVLGTATNSVGLAAGFGGNGFIAVTSLSNSPPVFGGYVPFAGSTSVTLPAGVPRGAIQASNDLQTALVRGGDLVSYAVTQVSSGFQFGISAENATLGLPGTAFRGRGAFAIVPTDGTRAVFAQAPTANQVTLVTGLPKAITVAGSVTLPTTPRSVAITPNGGYALVGADDGVYVLAGATGGTLRTLPAFAGAAGGTANALPFTGCDKQAHVLTNVRSVGVSGDGRYGVAFGVVPTGCAADGVLVAFPINVSTGGLATPPPNPSPSAAPFAQYFVQTNLGAQPAGTDAMFVR